MACSARSTPTPATSSSAGTPTSSTPTPANSRSPWSPILRAGGLGSGGFNFDAKLRRTSIDLEDLFHAHIGGFDTYALAFKIARRILADGKFEQFVANRYASYDAGFGKDIEKRKIGFTELEKLVLAQLGEPKPRSAKQEYLENLLAQYIACGA